MGEAKSVVGRKGKSLSLLVIGLVGAIAPSLVCNLRTWETTREHGQLVGTYRDWSPVAGGAIAIVFGLITVLVAAKERERLRIAMAIGVVLFGGFQIARGLGVFKIRVLNTVTTTRTGPAIDEPCADHDACLELGLSREKANDPAGARTAYAYGCKVGRGLNCYRAAGYYAAGKGTQPDPAKALELYGEACSRGFGDGCAEAGVMALAGKGTAQNDQEISELFRLGCEHESALGCYQHGLGLRDGRLGTAVDAPAAFAAFATACKGASAKGCIEYGTMFVKGIGVKQDASAAVEPFWHACELDDGLCHEYAGLHDGVDGVGRNEETARTYYGRACDAGRVESCGKVGHMLIDGRGGPADKAAGLAQLTKACKGGQQTACETVQNDGAPAKTK